MDAYRCFHVILEEYPHLTNPKPSTESDDDLSTLMPLTVAARKADGRFARQLLEKGADPTIEYNGLPPLAYAVTDGNLQTAQIIYENCSREQREKMLGYDDVTGISLMGRVMSTWHTRRRSEKLIQAIKWIAEEGGSTFICSLRHQAPIWAFLLGHLPSSLPKEARLDRDMLELLFDLFPGMLNTPDSRGCCPIHLATMNGNRAAIDLLLHRGVDVNVESTGDMIPKGTTAFSIAAQRLASSPPDDVAKGGRVEIRRWRERMNDIVELLLSKGATQGKTSTFMDTLQHLEHTMPQVQVFAKGSRDEDDEYGLGREYLAGETANGRNDFRGGSKRGRGAHETGSERNGADAYLRACATHPKSPSFNSRRE